MRAEEDVPGFTLICEYAGEVHPARQSEYLFSTTKDSIMELVHAKRSVNSRIIDPDNHGNLARFISGVNNYSEKSLQKQNVRSAKFDIDGRVHVLLYTFRRIKKGEYLYYDYNAGGSSTYPTEEFV